MRLSRVMDGAVGGRGTIDEGDGLGEIIRSDDLWYRDQVRVYAELIDAKV